MHEHRNKKQENRDFTYLVQGDNSILTNVIVPNTDSVSAGQAGCKHGYAALQ